MCGSDWPVALLNGDYDRVWDAQRRVVSAVAPGEEDALLGGTASRVYGLSEGRRGMSAVYYEGAGVFSVGDCRGAAARRGRGAA